MPTFEHHIDLLERVFLKLRLANLKLKACKCQLFCDKLVYLGHMVSGEGIQPDPGSIEKVKQWRKPQSAAELRSFLGLASYYRKFCEGFAEIASELYKLTEKSSRWNWNDEVHSKNVNTFKHDIKKSFFDDLQKQNDDIFFYY